MSRFKRAGPSKGECWLHLLNPPPSPPAAPGTASYTAPSTGATYIVNTKPATFAAAEAFCNRNGGHLASYTSLEEQNETETNFVASGEGLGRPCAGAGITADYSAAAGVSLASPFPAGALLPGFHKSYWLGLAITDRWPLFGWLDLSPAPPRNGSALGPVYAHWGYYMPQNILEPNNIFGAEDCGVANATQAYGGAWGWSDTRCNASLPFICRVTREQPRCFSRLQYLPGSQVHRNGCMPMLNTLVPLRRSLPVVDVRLRLHQQHLHLQQHAGQPGGRLAGLPGGGRRSGVLVQRGWVAWLLAHACSGAAVLPGRRAEPDAAAAGEQSDAERYFIGTGRLLPENHTGYWMGLKGTAGGGPSSFRCGHADPPAARAPIARDPLHLMHWCTRRCRRWGDNNSFPLAYQHWGLYGGKEREPNNRWGDEQPWSHACHGSKPRRICASLRTG